MTVEQLSSNDFERLVRQVGPAMLAYARRRTDPNTAEDVVAEALAVLWRRHPEVPTTGISEENYDATAWAVGITRKCLANAQRSARRHVTLMGKVATMADRPTSDQQDYVDSDRNEPLHKALGSLRPPDRELLRLWAWDDLKPAQIAAVLETSPENVSVRLHRAKQRLAAALKSLDDGTRGGRNALPSAPHAPDST